MGKRSSEYSEMNEPVEVENVKALRKTVRALLVNIDDVGEFWIPFSVIDDDSEVFDVGHEGTLILPRWFVEDRGIQ